MPLLTGGSSPGQGGNRVRVPTGTRTARSDNARAGAPPPLDRSEGDTVCRGMHRIVRWVTLALCCTLVGATAGSAEDYLARLRETLAQTGADLPRLSHSAERAAAAFAHGGTLWVTGRQADFITEACGRAGGLMASTPLGQRSPGRSDIVLEAVPGQLTGDEAHRSAEWQTQGVVVVTFASRAGLFQGRCPVDSVANIAALWAWTGEFVAASTRRGRMPVLYQSYGLPGGIDWAKKYQGKKFHDDLTITPIASGVLGKAYLEQLDGMLATLERTQGPKLRQAAAWWRDASKGSSLTLFTGHMFPRHAQDSRAPTFSALAEAPPEVKPGWTLPTDSPAFLLYLGYQFAPAPLLSQLEGTATKVVYCTVRPVQPPEPATNICYLDPGWPVTDACVTVPGYAIAILPASGVVQAAIYWTLVAERAWSAP